MKEANAEVEPREKLKVTKADIIVTGTKKKPYFEIKYKEVGKKHYNIGYGSYDLYNVFKWREEEMEIVSEVEAEYGNGWISCSEKLPEPHLTYDIFKRPDRFITESVLVTVKSVECDGEKYYVGMDIMTGTNKEDMHWLMSCGYGGSAVYNQEITAWMPKPEAYQGKCIEIDCRQCINCTGKSCEVYGDNADEAVKGCAEDNFKNFKTKVR